jgi:hypothetical protein
MDLDGDGELDEHELGAGLEAAGIAVVDRAALLEVRCPSQSSTTDHDGVA